jgi:addiction module HigA family antidote
MMSKVNLKGLRPVHPGELLREDVIPALGKPKTGIAALLKVSRQTLYDILAGKQPITPPMALRIGKLTGTTAESWLRMQQAYDLAIAKREMADELDAIPTLEALAA